MMTAMAKQIPSVSAAALAALSLASALRPPVEPVAPGAVIASKRHDDHDAVDVQDGAEREPLAVVTVPAVNFGLNAEAGSYVMGGVHAAFQSGTVATAPK
jgi:hypothetical protein